jgi:hypothetical protein
MPCVPCIRSPPTAGATGSIDSSGTLDGRFALYPDTSPNGILFFAADDGENASLHVAALAIFGAALTSDEVAALGGAGNPIPLPNPDNQTPTVAPPVAGPTAVATGALVDYTLTASDPDDDDVQVQIDWIDGDATLRSQLVRRMEHYGVDLCFSGHMHGYERGHLNGVNYIIAGGGSYLDFPEPLLTGVSPAGTTASNGRRISGPGPGSSTRRVNR